MRGIHFFNLVIIFAASFFTWSALAATPLKVHVMDNLSPAESKIALKELARLGYTPTTAPLFSESEHAVIITKTLSHAGSPENFSIEFLELKKEEALPRTLFEMKEKSGALESLLKSAPGPTQIKETKPRPVAALDWQVKRK